MPCRRLTLAATLVVAAAALPAAAGPLPVVTTEMREFLVIGTGNQEAFLMSNVEIGADQEVVTSSDISAQQRTGGPGVGYPSGSAPALESDFFPGDVRNNAGEAIYVPNQNTNGTPGTQRVNNRWNDIDPSAASGQDVVGTPDTLGIAGDGRADARPLFEGIDWSGEVAITNRTGTFNSSNSDVNAHVGIRCAQSAAGCAPSLSGNNAFFDGSSSPNTAQNLQPGTGITTFDPTAVVAELTSLKTYIGGAATESTFTQNITDRSFKDGGSPFVIDLDSADSNNDGVAIIDIDRNGSSFEINNSDVILLSTKGTIGIFRLVNGTTHYNFANSSIMLGEEDWDETTNPLGLNGDVIDELGAMFVIDSYEGENNVFGLNNVILGGIGLYDLIDIAGNTSPMTEIVMNNAQGCAQFIANRVNMQNNRWNRCSFADEPEADIPAPGGLPLFAAAVAVLGGLRLRRRR